MKKVIFVLILILFFFIIQNLLHSIFSLWQKRELLINTRNEVAKSKEENQQLKEQMSAVKRPSFIEKQAREKLFMTKPGEQIVVIPDNIMLSEKTEKPALTETKANWQLWWELFF